MPDWPAIVDRLAASGIAARPAARPLSGGDISAAWKLESDDGALFVKTGPPDALPMFTAEQQALAELAAAEAVRVPRALAADVAGGTAFLALEFLPLSPPDAAANRAFGTALAALHRRKGDSFGWHRDNTIGSTPQPNPASDDWIGFFREQRLEHQLGLAAGAGYRGRLQDDGLYVAERLEHLFADYEPEPSLLHGDLWGGNWASSNGEPVMFDPAIYYGDRETDLAMTRLFGGFRAEFYDAYEAAWPLAPGSETRLPLYQLYHVLNHLNLFGGAYLGRAESLLAGLRRRLGGARARGGA